MARTFLQLTQRLARECGVAGTGPSTTVSQTGEAGRLVNWINAAWLDIQEAHEDWDWLRTSTTFTTTDAQSTYTLADIGVSTTLGRWKDDSFRYYITASGYGTETFLSLIDYDNWRDFYSFGAQRSTTGAPSVVAISPVKSVCLGVTPDSTGYTVVADYFTIPTEMSADADVPALPSRFELAIVYRAMMMYGSYNSAPEVYQHGQTEFNRMMRRLELDQQPTMLVGESLA